MFPIDVHMSSNDDGADTEAAIEAYYSTHLDAMEAAISDAVNHVVHSRPPRPVRAMGEFLVSTDPVEETCGEDAQPAEATAAPEPDSEPEDEQPAEPPDHFDDDLDEDALELATFEMMSTMDSGAKDQADSCKFELRLGSLPSGVTVYDEEGKLVPQPTLESNPTTRMTSVVVPAGGHLRCVPTVDTEYSGDSHFRYWSVAFEVQYTTSGEGGGFGLLTVSDAFEKAEGQELPLYVASAQLITTDYH